ncbi:MAG: ATP-binding protein [Kofleriaceae bacterium]
MRATSSLNHLSDHLELMSASMHLRACALGGAGEDEGRRWLAAIAERQHRIEERARDADLASARLVAQLELSATEEQVIWLLAAIAMRRDVRLLVARCSGESTPAPTLEAVRSIVYGDLPNREALEELGARGTLRSLGVIERSDHSAEHESRQTWALSRRVLSWLHGHCSTQHAATGSEVGDVPALDSLAIDARAIATARTALAQPESSVIAAGLPGLGRRTLLVAATREAGREVLELDARTVAAETATETVRAFALECRLADCVPLFSNLDLAADSVFGGVVEHLPRFAKALVTMGVVRRTLRVKNPVVHIDLVPPSSELRARVWTQSLGTDGRPWAERYPIAPSLVARAVSAARARAGRRDVDESEVAIGVRSVLDESLAQFAARIEVSQTWDDIVLGEEQGDAVLELLGRIRGRACVYERWGFARKVGKGLGVAALFSGPPGTGKTMLASLVARELGMELYQVDMGKVISKYVGETERNLGQLFDAAEAGQAILLFDEADAMFGKRTQVKSSNDRYANLETNFLLQRLESYTGICILTSNHEGNIDPAFGRRLAVHIRFEMPAADERAQLWRAMLATKAPLADDLSIEKLAHQYEMSGGHIRNAVLSAAFIAAAKGCAITTSMLQHAAKAEYRALGKLLV